MANSPMPPHSTACFVSLGDLNFMQEHLIAVWTIRRIRCWISAVDRAGYSHRPEPKTTSATRDQCRWQPAVRRDQCPKASVKGPGSRVQKASVKRASTLQQPASLRAVNWRRKARPIANEKPSRLLGPSVAPVVLFVFGDLGQCCKHPLQHDRHFSAANIFQIAGTQFHRHIVAACLSRLPRLSKTNHRRTIPRFVEHHHASREGTRVHDPRRYAHAKSMIDAVTGLQPSPLDGECSSETQATPKQKPGEKSAKTPRIENE